MKVQNVDIENSWKEALKEEFSKPYFDKIKAHLVERKLAGKTIYPPGKLIFNAFNSTPFDQVKVVILGQDPYHGPGEAMGLCFSVNKGIKIPPSLRNIYKELNRDCGIPIPNHGDLTSWTGQGVFLLNAMLTVEHKSPGSHKKIGWQEFTNAVIKILSDKKDGLIFLLWGNFARNKKEFIDEIKHHVLEAPHPSPLAGGGFSGCSHFSHTNNILQKTGQTPINWKIN
jgi:uracil-DNA glycosylase